MNSDNKKSVPDALKKWFILHFAADTLFAIPMFLIPIPFLTLLGWKIVDPIATRMVAAALLGIGIESLLSRNATRDSFKTMLSLKIIWSTAAIIALATGLISGLFTIVFVAVSLLMVFVLFNVLWTYWFIRLRK